MATSATRRRGNQSAPLDDSSRRVRRINRRQASGLLPGRLPPEIWMQIIGEYSSRRELRALGTSCRFFHRITQTSLYKRLNFDTPVERTKIVSGNLRNSLSLFERSFQARPELGALIHDLSLYVPTPSLDKKTRFSPRTLLSKIAQLSNLKRLRVRGAQVNANLCDSIFSRPRLSAVEFVECVLDDSLLASHIPQSQSSISDLKILLPRPNTRLDTSVSDGAWATLATADLQSLTLSVSYQPDENPILSSIVASGKSKMLEKLSINYLPSSIIDFLISSPRIRHLKFDNMIPVHATLPFSPLPADAIPLLEYYEGPGQLLPTLLRNRPVKTVVIKCGYNCEDSYVCADILDSLELSSVPVTTLKFSHGLVEPWLSKVPITICHLAFSLLAQQENSLPLTESSRPALSRLRNLRTLCAIPSWLVWGQYLRHEEILEISETLPSLQEFHLYGIEKWVMTKPKAWERFRYQTDVEDW